MLNEQKAYVKQLIKFYELQSNMYGAAAKDAKEYGDNEKYTLYLEKQVIYHEMKSDLEKLLTI